MQQIEMKWYKTSEQKPSYSMFGKSSDVLGIDEDGNRDLYFYERGSWCVYSGANPTRVWSHIYPVEAPIYWHPLLSRKGLELFKE